jgi:hypothetical protein
VETGSCETTASGAGADAAGEDESTGDCAEAATLVIFAGTGWACGSKSWCIIALTDECISSVGAAGSSTATSFGTALGDVFQSCCVRKDAPARDKKIRTITLLRVSALFDSDFLWALVVLTTRLFSGGVNLNWRFLVIFCYS